MNNYDDYLPSLFIKFLKFLHFVNNYDDYLPSLFIKFLKFLHFVNDAGEVIVLPLKFILGVLFFIYELKDYKKYQRKCLVNFCFKLTENG